MVDAFPIREAGPAGSQPPVLATLRSAIRQAGGRVVLRVPVMSPHRRRVARALLQEGALAAGGIVAEGPDEDLLLIGAEAGRAGRLRGLLDRLLGARLTSVWSLEHDAQALLAYAGSAAGTGMRPGIAAPQLAGLDAWLRELPLGLVIARQRGVRLASADGPGRPAFLRLSVQRPALARMLGPLGQDGDLLDHACRSLAARLLQAIGDPAGGRALIGPRSPGPLHLAGPLHPAVQPAHRDDQPDAAPARAASLVATYGAEEVADLDGLRARRAALAAQGWLLEIDGLDAEALRLLAPEALPADRLRLVWSPDMMSEAVAEALRPVDPERLILAGVDCAAALDWGLRVGVRLMEGEAAEASVPADPPPARASA